MRRERKMERLSLLLVLLVALARMLKPNFIHQI